MLLEKYRGNIPKTMEELLLLPGVARKTANVVLGVAFGIASGVVVDTHVGRLSRRMGLTRDERPDKVEADLMALLPRKEWINFSHRMIMHGRQICIARKPRCSICPVANICPSAQLADPQEIASP
jgi:endonuclease-3